jgi:hypothetical protein
VFRDLKLIREMRVEFGERPEVGRVAAWGGAQRGVGCLAYGERLAASHKATEVRPPKKQLNCRRRPCTST